jgi:ABC-type polysaccharide/polyol phosphate export permease
MRYLVSSSHLYVGVREHGLPERVRELWRYRELFYHFARRDIKVRYKQTTLGLL